MSRSQIPEVHQGVIRVEGDIIEVGSLEWQQWLESAVSFRYVPTSDAPFTVRKEKGTKGQQSYWYGYRKVSGKLSKRYIGRDDDLSVTQLEKTAHELTRAHDESPLKSPKNIPPPQNEESCTSEEIVRLQAEIARLQVELQKQQKKLKA